MLSRLLAAMLWPIDWAPVAAMRLASTNASTLPRYMSASSSAALRERFTTPRRARRLGEQLLERRGGREGAETGEHVGGVELHLVIPFVADRLRLGAGGFALRRDLCGRLASRLAVLRTVFVAVLRAVLAVRSPRWQADLVASATSVGLSLRASAAASVWVFVSATMKILLVLQCNINGAAHHFKGDLCDAAAALDEAQGCIARAAMDAVSTDPTRKRRGLLIVLSSPSGAGKSTLSRMLMDADPEITMSVSATTRPKRPGEKDGVIIISSTIPSSTG
jgi:hypothetical protein